MHPPLQDTPKFKPFYFPGYFLRRGAHLRTHWPPAAAKGHGGGSPLKKDSASGDRVPRQETTPPLDSDKGSELGESGVESAGEGSGEEPSTSSGERRVRARRVRVVRRWLDPHKNLENDWRKGGRHIQLYWTLMHAFQMGV